MLARIYSRFGSYFAQFYASLYTDEISGAGGTPPTSQAELLLETGFHLLKEDGGTIILD